MTKSNIFDSFVRIGSLYLLLGKSDEVWGQIYAEINIENADGFTNFQAPLKSFCCV